MKLIPKALRVFAYLWLTFASLLIGASMISIWYTDGFGKVQEIFSPFNLVNFIAVAVTLSPGLGALALSDRMELRFASQSSSDSRIAPGDPGFLEFTSKTKWVNGEAVRTVVVDDSGRVAAAAWEDGAWVVKSEGVVSVFSVIEGREARPGELARVGLAPGDSGTAPG
ncbi:MAG: hypothetical protein QF637_13250 [Acidimicrobiales bacterium]|jgi:hypothetical protein|nr:hypothetical protein [Acidimicrobiales bacterium]